MAAGDPGEKCRGNAKYSEYQFGTDLEGKLEFCFIRKRNLDEIVCIENVLNYFLVLFRCARAWNPCLH